MFFEGELPGGVGSGVEFAVDFVGVGVSQELVEEGVGGLDGEDVVGGEQRREALLPVIMAAFDFAFGLWSGGEAERDAVEVKSGAELGEGVWSVREKEGVIIDVEGEREAVFGEDAREEVEVGEEVFGVVETSAGVEASGVIEDVEERLPAGLAGQPGVGGGIVLPKRAEITGLPAADGFGGFFETGVRGEALLAGPAADAGAVGLEAEPAEQFAGDGAVGGGRARAKQARGEGEGFLWPRRPMIAARRQRLPICRAASGAGAEVSGAKLVETAEADPQLGGGLG